jgi:tetratricopeptide (TPR) repeat protein
VQTIAAQEATENPELARLFNQTGFFLYEQGHYAEAEPLYTQALDIYRSQLGPDHPDTAQSLNNLAGLYYAQGRYSEAEMLYLQSIAILYQQLGETHPNTQAGLGNFVNLLQQVVAAGRSAELSDHPVTQALLAQLQTESSPD